MKEQVLSVSVPRLLVEVPMYSPPPPVELSVHPVKTAFVNEIELLVERWVLLVQSSVVDVSQEPVEVNRL